MAMKKLSLAGVTALLMATGAVHAKNQAYYQCGKDVIFVNLGNGFTDYELVTNEKKERRLPGRFFRWNNKNGILYYRGRKCQWREWP
jgi:hypothetical protein